MKPMKTITYHFKINDIVTVLREKFISETLDKSHYVEDYFFIDVVGAKVDLGGDDELIIEVAAKKQE